MNKEDRDTANFKETIGSVILCFLIIVAAKLEIVWMLTLISILLLLSTMFLIYLRNND